MSNFFISLGVINKKMLFPLIYIIIHILINIFENVNFKINELSLCIGSFGVSIGEISTFFVAQKYRYNRISKEKKKTPLKQYVVDYFFLFLISLSYHLINLSPYYFIESDDEQEKEEASKFDELFIIDVIEIILVTLVTYFLLKYKYYIHHIISLIILAILSTIIDLLLGSFINVNLPLVIISLFTIITDSIYYSYTKYLIEKKYYYLMDILFVIGIFDLIMSIIAFGIILLVQKINGTYKLIFQFYEFYNTYGAWYILAFFLIELIIHGLILFLLEMKILEMLGPNFVCLSYLIGKIPSAIIFIEGNNRWIVLVLSVFQILFILFYLEILEFNFCSLNKNTKKNISERELKQEKDDDNDDDIDIKGYDISESINLQKKIENLNEMKEIFNEKENDD